MFLVTALSKKEVNLNLKEYEIRHLHCKSCKMDKHFTYQAAKTSVSSHREVPARRGAHQPDETGTK